MLLRLHVELGSVARIALALLTGNLPCTSLLAHKGDTVVARGKLTIHRQAADDSAADVLMGDLLDNRRPPPGPAPWMVRLHH
jgi:hypothetical protein